MKVVAVVLDEGRCCGEVDDHPDRPQVTVDLVGKRAQSEGRSVPGKACGGRRG
jgi:hypothetical protein